MPNRSRAYRRYHTGRVISNRQRRYRRIVPPWVVQQGYDRYLPAGRLDDRFAYYGCGNSRCQLCHWDKFDPSRRARVKRAWEREVQEQLDAM